MFQDLVERALDKLEEKFEARHPHLDLDRSPQVLEVVLPDGKGTYLLNAHLTQEQLWLSSPLSGGRHFVYSEAYGQWLDTRNQEDLDLLLEREILGEAPLIEV